jgi:nucleotide-binding universal stress UspA family protein
MAESRDVLLTDNATAVPRARPVLPHPGVAFESLRSYLATARADAQTRLEASVPRSVRDVCTVETIVAEGKPYREIDLFFFGSTAQHVVRRAACPVLTVRTS